MAQRLATYRLQLRPGFGFREAAELLPYLRDLGVSHVYCSPCFQAARGSTHGYDIVDPGRISGELGGADALADLRARMSELGLEQVLDIVPNHMCVSDRGNWRWWDVLEDGRQSPWAETFDIDWEASARVVLPVLGDTLDAVLARGELQLEGSAGDVVVRYFDSTFPLSLASMVDGLAAVPRFKSLAAGIEHLGEASDDASRRRRAEQRREIHEGLDRAMTAAGGAVLLGELLQKGMEGTDQLLARQHYRLAHWREAATAINYRRFFDINSLAGVRVEQPSVFEDTQRLAIELVTDGIVDGLRVDHVDGLRLPREYLGALRARVGDEPWLLVEKILDRGERVPDDWPVDGTTGYEFSALAGGLFVHPEGRDRLSALATELTGTSIGPEVVISASKHLVCERIFPGDIARISRLLHALCAARPELSLCTLAACTRAVTALLVGLPVYRTYSSADGAPLSAQDREALNSALLHARATANGDGTAPLELVRSLIEGGAHSSLEVDFVLRLQQVSASVTAKGVEDTAFYRCVSLVSLDEVGDAPTHRGTTPGEFHAHNAATAQRSPTTMLATSTHDTKRSEDVRMRLHVLSEFAELWADRVRGWCARNAQHKTSGMPDTTDELLLYQTLVGAHPLEEERAVAYMEKATREAKRRTSWTDPDEAYDAAVQGFTRTLIVDTAFMREMHTFAVPLSVLGRANSLGLTLLKLTSPGVPDIYQGTELWDFSLVDPDNRRPVDFELRRSLLADPSLGMSEWSADSGEAKVALIARALALRRRHAGSFAPGGAYRRLDATGTRAQHVVALQRGNDVIAVATRLVGQLNGWSAQYAPAWSETSLELPAGRWNDVLSDSEHTGETSVAALLGAVPVALLEHTA